MIISEPEPEDDGWRAAEAALAAAQQMPGGPERVAALKKARQLRFTADASEQSPGSHRIGIRTNDRPDVPKASARSACRHAWLAWR